jgi:glucose 1-dehydrogenase
MLLMKSIVQEVAALRIRVNSICPGAIRTPMNNSAWENREAYDSLMTLIPYKRIGEPEEIGRLAAFLASDLCRLYYWSQHLCGCRDVALSGV